MEARAACCRSDEQAISAVQADRGVEQPEALGGDTGDGWECFEEVGDVEDGRHEPGPLLRGGLGNDDPVGARPCRIKADPAIAARGVVPTDAPPWRPVVTR